MINKKLKNFLELKSTHSKNTSNQTILKLRAIQKSREKSKQKKHQSSFNAYHNQSFAQTTQSTFHPQSRQKQKFSSINTQIKQLQEKVDILLCQKTKQRSNTPTRKILSSFGPQSKQRYSNSKQKSQNSTNIKNQTLRNSFLNTFDSFQQITNYNDHNEHNRSLLQLKLQAAKLLTYLNLRPQQINYFQQSTNPQQLFAQLSSILNIHITKKIKQTQQQTTQYKDRQIYKMHEQVQRLKSQLKHQQSLITQLQKQRIQLKDKNLDITIRNQQQQTEIYQLKLLYEQSSNNLIKVNIQHQNQCQVQRNKIRLQYQTKLHKLINNIHKKDYIHTQLKSIISEQSTKSHQYQINTNLLLNDIEKWQREYMRLTQRYEEERLDRNNVQEEKNMEMYRFAEYKEMMAEGYVSLVEKLTQEMNVLREGQAGLEQQIGLLKDKIKQYESRIKDTESDYLCLNDDYTRDVREWVTKEEYYEKTVKELRHQIFQAYETIAEYSKMLATCVGKNSALDTTGQE